MNVDIRVNQFYVKRNGEIYGPGGVLYGVPDEEGKKLVEESNGELEVLPENTATDAPGANEAGEIKLPKVDPAKTVDAGTKK